jgi:hypothetical protein
MERSAEILKNASPAVQAGDAVDGVEFLFFSRIRVFNLALLPSSHTAREAKKSRNAKNHPHRLVILVLRNAPAVTDQVVARSRPPRTNLAVDAGHHSVIQLRQQNVTRQKQSHPSGIPPDACSSRASQDSVLRPSPDRLLAAPRRRVCRSSSPRAEKETSPRHHNSAAQHRLCKFAGKGIEMSLTIIVVKASISSCSTSKSSMIQQRRRRLWGPCAVDSFPS